MRISDWSSDVCSSDLTSRPKEKTVEEKPVQYTIVRETSRLADLVLAEPSEENARKAIKRYADGILSSGSSEPEYVITALGNREDKSYICRGRWIRSEEHTSELQSLMRISYAVFCLKKKQRNSNE